MPEVTTDGIAVPLLRKDGLQVGEFKIDAADAVWVNQWTWRLVAGCYAGRSRWARGHGHSEIVYLHRVLMGIGRGDRREVDHINRDRLDNRRSNLRVVSRRENAQNLTQRRGTKSGHRGVYWDDKRQRWWAQAEVDGRRHWGGYFTDLDEAAEAAVRLRQRVMTHSVEGVHA